MSHLDPNRQTLLLRFLKEARQVDAHIVKHLLSYPQLQVNARNNQGWTALHWAAERDASVEVWRLLADKGADFNITMTKWNEHLLSWYLGKANPDMEKVMLIIRHCKKEAKLLVRHYHLIKPQLDTAIRDDCLLMCKFRDNSSRKGCSRLKKVEVREIIKYF